MSGRHRVINVLGRRTAIRLEGMRDAQLGLVGGI
jgi:hypothetical protein